MAICPPCAGFSQNAIKTLAAARAFIVCSSFVQLNAFCSTEFVLTYLWLLAQNALFIGIYWHFPKSAKDYLAITVKAASQRKERTRYKAYDKSHSGPGLLCVAEQKAV